MKKIIAISFFTLLLNSVNVMASTPRFSQTCLNLLKQQPSLELAENFYVSTHGSLVMEFPQRTPVEVSTRDVTGADMETIELELKKNRTPIGAIETDENGIKYVTFTVPIPFETITLCSTTRLSIIKK
jgi:hypothetical protein